MWLKKTKILKFCIVGLFIGICFLPCIIINDAQFIQTPILDILDQESTKDDDTRLVTTFRLAQSFKPTLPRLTKIKLLLTKTQDNAIYESYNVEIRKDDLTSQTLTQANLGESSIQTGTSWTEFNIPDIDVDIGSTYFIILYGQTSTGETGSVSWHYGYPNPYENGNAYRNTPGGWYELNVSGMKADFCFKTYGIPDNQAPSRPIITGPLNGKIRNVIFYNFTSIDPDNDNIQYFIEFSQGEGYWTDFHPSGETVQRGWRWTKTGTYIIRCKAKDVEGLESDWATIEITLPKPYNRFILFNWIVEKFPILKNLFNSMIL